LICPERTIFKNITERKNIIKDSPTYKNKFGKNKKEVKDMFIQIFLLRGKLKLLTQNIFTFLEKILKSKNYISVKNIKWYIQYKKCNFQSSSEESNASEDEETKRKTKTKVQNNKNNKS